ncbi:saccharopine dehydrogenase family protein [Rhodospirillum rubrum]|uniref:Saccharopine dehydrogenase n=1 Tax=Rhodospirillum rubrum (strain ATCC 11170 / ATH 1.1.1 / DSM 467 / LMG 4362 / NCIMB 8255 / S1) TaxID=269796 RepID=Q2RQI8_RHORT|nr:saccharopine dehydrogenase NADP-binding domain-containing protein [Rhodospirillum rubrum]ABC23607.1 Saccharopine dehydrogenase [Rhodospirillum rubrum ATCC 11170]AEO49345.1 saccharopine dehydrogenase [Rhodospirillum rubrum F11]MBK5955282.1 saccharopine dehydrogenase [Rhodospirillum rubrum]QXG79569.1 saccharopine dehydrogenase NADP-binding domain-containing protein [Rhodospirillum rubrum]HAP99944.1 saccharopine dehydrogenase [Rhodospirillum rubrum]
MTRILLLGGGKIGEAIATLLGESGDYQIVVGDRSAQALAGVAALPGVTPLVIDASDEDAVAAAAGGAFAILSACPFFLTVGIARAARRAGAHYLDLTEDVASTAEVRALAEGATSAFIPQCGLAPGFISIAANDLAQSFDSLDSLRLRVGALPRFPTNGLKYNLSWSTQGLVNEYLRPCEAIVDGRLTTVQPMDGLESFSLDGVAYEAFNTSGGLGSLCETYAGRLRALDYRSVRYPGHCALMKVLLDDLGLSRRPELLCELLDAGLPITAQDMVLVLVTARGQRQGRFIEESLISRIFGKPVAGRQLSAIGLTTASGITAVLDLLVEGALPDRGLIRQEDIPLPLFRANRFGRNYWPDEAEAAQGAQAPARPSPDLCPA